MRKVVLWGGRGHDVQFGSAADRRQEAWRRQRAVWMRLAVSMAQLQASAVKAATIMAQSIRSAMLDANAVTAAKLQESAQ